MAGPSVWGWLHFKVPLHMLGSSFVTTPFNPGNVAAGSSSVGSLITPYVRGVFRGGWVGGWEGWLCGDCECYRVRGGLGLRYNLQ